MSGNRRGGGPAKPEARARSEGDCSYLSQRSNEEDNDRDRSKCDGCTRPIGCEGSRHPPDRLCDHRNSDELEAMQETLGQRSLESGYARRKCE